MPVGGAGAGGAVSDGENTIDALSGGQFQRMLFARMWCSRRRW
jgi:ABC-type Mn2+/Zn2+ transport system ATPase subunit